MYFCQPFSISFIDPIGNERLRRIDNAITVKLSTSAKNYGDYRDKISEYSTENSWKYKPSRDHAPRKVAASYPPSFSASIAHIKRSYTIRRTRRDKKNGSLSCGTVIRTE